MIPSKSPFESPSQSPLEMSLRNVSSKCPFEKSLRSPRARPTPTPPAPPRRERPWVGDARACCASALARPLGAPNRTSPRHAATNRKGHLHTRYTINISTRLKVICSSVHVFTLCLWALASQRYVLVAVVKYYRGKSVYKTSENTVIKILTF